MPSVHTGYAQSGLGCSPSVLWRRLSESNRLRWVAASCHRPMTTNVVGAPGRNRTCDLPLTEGARYQTALLERYTLCGGWPLHLCSPAGWRRTQGWSCAVESNHLSRFMGPAFTRVRARGGRWRIRTPEGLRPTAFQAVPLGHSGNLPVPTVLGRAPGALREAYTNRLGRPLRSRTVPSRI